MIINVLYQLIIGLVYPALPLYMKSIEIGIVLISVIISLTSIVSFISSIIIGYVYDKVKNRRRLLLIDGLIGALILLILAEYLPSVFIFPLVGFSISSIYPIIMASASEGENVEERMGLFWVGGSIGWAIGTGLTGFMLVNFSIHYIFLVAVILYMLMVYISFKAHSDYVYQTQKVYNVSLFSFILSFIIIFVMFSIDVVKNLYLPQYYAYYLHTGVPFATVTLSVESFLEIPSIMLFTYLIKGKVKDVEIFTLSFALSAIYLIANSLAYNSLTALASMSFYCLVWGSFIVSSSLIVNNLSGKLKGVGFGTFNALYPLAGIITPLYMGFMIKAFGYKLSLLYLSALPLIAGIMYYLSWRSLSS